MLSVFKHGGIVAARSQYARDKEWMTKEWTGMDEATGSVKSFLNMIKNKVES